jgi:hypothetical protein
MRRIGVDDVVTDPASAFGRIDMPLAAVANIALVHRPRLHVMKGFGRDIARTQGTLTRDVIRHFEAVVHKLNARQRVMGMDLVDHKFVNRQIAIVPDPHQRRR